MIELMIVLVILAILVSVGAPAFRTFILEQRARATTTDLRLALMTARSEAVKRNRDVALTPAAGGWQDGWTIANPEAGEPDLLNHTQPDNTDVAVTLAGTNVVFEASGRAEEQVIFTVEVGSGSEAVTKCLKLSLNGYMDNDCS